LQIGSFAALAGNWRTYSKRLREYELREVRIPMRFDVKTDSGVEGYAVVVQGMITVHATKGAKGSRTTQVGTTDPTTLAELLLYEIEIATPQA
jgi:hypothetical protein